MIVKVSVIVPVYRVEKYISECIESILNQTFKEFELILIDDGSDDLSADICKKYAMKDERVIFIQTKNNGVAVARNNGLDIARGEYIIFVDSDDYIDKSMIQTMYKEIIRTKADIVGCEHIHLNSNGDEIKSYNIKNQIINLDYCDETQAYELLKGYFIHIIWKKIYKKSIIDKYNIRFIKGFSLGEDLLFNIEYLYKAPIINTIEKHLYIHRENCDSLTNKLISSKDVGNYIYSSNKLIKFSNDKFKESDKCKKWVYEITGDGYINYTSNIISQNKITIKQKRNLIKQMNDIEELDICIDAYLRKNDVNPIYSYIIRVKSIYLHMFYNMLSRVRGSKYDTRNKHYCSNI